LGFARHSPEDRASPTSICGVVDSSLSLLRAVMRHDRIDLQVSVPDDLPNLCCHSQQIQQVLLNLVTNARDALNSKYPEHDENKRIELSAVRYDDRSGPWVRLTVADTGPGIPDHVKERMFDSFFTTKQKGKGTGLGLAISQGIVRDHGGSIGVETQVGEYTRMHVNLPLNAAY